MLIAHSKEEKSRSPEISARSCDDRIDTRDESYELVLAAEDVDNKGQCLNSSRFHDVVFLGHKDGCVLACRAFTPLLKTSN